MKNFLTGLTFKIKYHVRTRSSDGEIHDIAENFVKTRLEMPKDSMNRVSGIAEYGSPNDPFENQIEKRVAHLLEKRQRARNLLQAIEKFSGINQ